MVKPILPLAILALLLGSCDGGGGSPTSDGSGSALTGATTLKVGTDSYLPIMGGEHESKHVVKVGGVSDTVVQTTVSFFTAGGALGNTRFMGSILLVNPALATYPIDTSFSSYNRPLAAELSFYRYRVGSDTCYYEAVSGSLQLTGWSDTTAVTRTGHLISGSLAAQMVSKVDPPFAACTDAPEVRLEFHSIFVQNTN